MNLNDQLIKSMQYNAETEDEVFQCSKCAGFHDTCCTSQEYIICQNCLYSICEECIAEKRKHYEHLIRCPYCGSENLDKILYDEQGNLIEEKKPKFTYLASLLNKIEIPFEGTITKSSLYFFPEISIEDHQRDDLISFNIMFKEFLLKENKIEFWERGYGKSVEEAEKNLKERINKVFEHFKSKLPNIKFADPFQPHKNPHYVQFQETEEQYTLLRESWVKDTIDDSNLLEKCPYCSNLIPEGQDACEECKIISKEIYDAEMKCEICQNHLNGSPNDGEVERIVVMNQIGGWEDWDWGDIYHILCPTCYNDHIKPICSKNYISPMIIYQQLRSKLIKEKQELDKKIIEIRKKKKDMTHPYARIYQISHTLDLMDNMIKELSEKDPLTAEELDAHTNENEYGMVGKETVFPLYNYKKSWTGVFDIGLYQYLTLKDESPWYMYLVFAPGIYLKFKFEVWEIIENVLSLKIYLKENKTQLVFKTENKRLINEFKQKAEKMGWME